MQAKSTLRMVAAAEPASTQQEAHKTHDAQKGILEIEAITKTWSRKSLIVAFALIWLVSFITSLQPTVTSALTPYVTSAFQQHSLTPTVNVLSSVIGGVSNLTVAKILDVVGRPHGYAASVVLTTIGLSIMAATTSVEMYAAAQVLLTVGSNSIGFTVGILVADMTSLHNRTLVTALTASSGIITTFIGGPIAQGFLSGPGGWQWCFGMFAIAVPIICLPLLVLLVVNYQRAKKLGTLKHEPQVTQQPGRTPQDTAIRVLHYLREFDAVGLLLLTAGLSMVLLPFNICTLQPQGWQSPLIIGLLVAGVILTVLFVLWERYLTRVTFIPYSLLLDRNVLGGCVLGAVLFASYFCWVTLFSSFLQVVGGLSITTASYVVQAYSVGLSVFAVATGLVIRYTGRYKPITLYLGIPLYALFTGLLIHLRQPDSSVGLVVMCQIFLSLASGVLTSTPQLAAMAVAEHQHVAVIVAVVSMASSIGGAVGSTVSGAIWQAVFPRRLAEYLPLEEKGNLLMIYGSLEVQLAYPVGSLGRLAIQKAYGDAQAYMLVVATTVWVIGAAAVVCWRDIDLRTKKQIVGQVF